MNFRGGAVIYKVNLKMRLDINPPGVEEIDAEANWLKLKMYEL